MGGELRIIQLVTFPHALWLWGLEILHIQPGKLRLMLCLRRAGHGLAGVGFVKVLLIRVLGHDLLRLGKLSGDTGLLHLRDFHFGFCRFGFGFAGLGSFKIDFHFDLLIFHGIGRRLGLLFRVIGINQHIRRYRVF